MSNVSIKKNDQGAQGETSAAKKRLLLEALSRVEKQCGKGSIMIMGEANRNFDLEVISTGSLLLDQALGCGGVPRGRIVEIYGPEASGKTTIALQIIAEVQKSGGVAAFIDAEHALDAQYAQSLGISVSDLVLSQPDYGEQALDIAEILVRSSAVDVIVVDSVAALVPKTELEGDMGDTHVGLQARLMSQALRKLTPLVHKSNVIMIFINQVRQNINSMPFAPKETTTGGNALKFYASLRLEVRRIESLKDKDGVQYGNRVNIKVVKNKLAAPFKVVSAFLIFGYGISKFYELFTLGIDHGLVEMHGSWVSCFGEKICQGREAFIEVIKKDLVLFEKLKKELSLLVQKKVSNTERDAQE
jgi:recombination protein RecA